MKIKFLSFQSPSLLSNPLLREILSGSSGEIDQETIEEDELLNDFLNPSTIEDTDDSDELSELFS